MAPIPNTLSICMIVKNEQEKIGHALQSFLPFADEIIVNDTGSTDNTIEIVKSFPKTVLMQSEWIGDFSYSRNLSLEKATCSWIIWMDADDYVPPESANDFLKWKKYPLNKLFQFKIIDTIENGKPFGRMFLQARMFPNRYDLRFKGKVHESVTEAALKANLDFYQTETEIWHTGYETNEAVKRKALRDLEIQKTDSDQENSITGLIEMGDAYNVLEQPEKALEYYSKAAELKSGLKDYIKTAMNKKANVLLNMNRMDEAFKVFEECSEKFPQSEEALFGLVTIYLSEQKYEAAIAVFKKLFNMKPEVTVGGNRHYLIRENVLRNLALAEIDMKNIKEAKKYAQLFVMEFPENLDASALLKKIIEIEENNKAQVTADSREKNMLAKEYSKQEIDYIKNVEMLIGRGDYGDAMKLVDKVLEINPKNEYAYFNMGKIFNNVGSPLSAILAYKAFLKIRPKNVSGLNNLALAYSKVGLANELMDVYNEILSFSKEPTTIYNLLFTSNYLISDPQKIFDLHKKWAAYFEQNKVKFRPLKPKTKGKKLRIGFVSADFQHHSCAFFLESLFKNYDREKYEFQCFYLSDEKDYYTGRFIEMSDKFHFVREQTEKQIADLIKKEEVHILVDLQGYTNNCRPGIYQYRPSYCIGSWLGYPNTTGLSAVDFRITDKVADDDSTKPFYTENLLQLDTLFLCYSPPLYLPIAKPHEPDENRIVFGCFNNTAKISDFTVELFASVLNAVPNSVMVFKNQNFDGDSLADWYKKRFAAFGIASERFFFMPRIDDGILHFKEYNKIDIALDTAPYNGTTTTFEAMSMGVPTLCLLGNSHVSRVSASINIHTGFSELVAKNKEEFVEIAKNLANNPKHLRELKFTMREKFFASPALDQKLFTEKWTSAVEEFFRKL